MNRTFGLRVKGANGSKCFEVKWDKVQSGACFVKYEVILKNASGRDLYIKTGYNIGRLQTCTLKDSTDVANVQLTVSFIDSSKTVIEKVPTAPINTLVPTTSGTPSIYNFLCYNIFYILIHCNSRIDSGLILWVCAHILSNLV